MIGNLKSTVLLHAKNVYGWKTKRKLVVISVDDYGNVRVNSKEARSKLDAAGLKVRNRFDAYDALEDREDLEILYDTLTSVKDGVGKPAVFTPFAVPCNIDFEKVGESNYQHYCYEQLPVTFAKLPGYEGAWDLWKEGIRTKLMVPQFHGREHLNLKVFEEKLGKRDHELLTCLNNRSYTSISNSGYPTISYTAAFEFWDFNENQRFLSIIKEGLDAFESVFGYRSSHFNSPGGREHAVIHKMLHDCGIKYIDAPWVKSEHQGNGKYRRMINYSGKRNDHGQLFMVRNIVFEPTERKNIDWVRFALRQIETSFYWNRPAIISSHRVNFCGHIDKKNRAIGIGALRELLQQIVLRWPDAEFVAAHEVAEMMESQRSSGN